MAANHLLFDLKRTTKVNIKIKASPKSNNKHNAYYMLICLQNLIVLKMYLP